MKAYTRERCLDALTLFALEHGHSPGVDEWRKLRLRPSTTTILRVLGPTWTQALGAAGLPTRRAGGQAQSPDRHDTQTAQCMERLLDTPDTLTLIAAEIGISGQALGRRIADYRARHDLPALSLPTGPPSFAALEAQQMARQP